MTPRAGGCRSSAATAAGPDGHDTCAVVGAILPQPVSVIARLGGAAACTLHAFRRTLEEDAFFQRRRRGIYVELPSNKIQSPIRAAYSIGVNLLVCKAGKMPLLDGA